MHYIKYYCQPCNITECMFAGHGKKTMVVLGRFMGRFDTEKKFAKVFQRSELKPGDPGYAIWSKPFSASIASEKSFNNAASGRFRKMLGKKLVLQEQRLPNGSIMDCIILECPGGVPRVLVEFKKPCTMNVEEANGQELNLLTHVHQPINYASQILFEHPEISTLPIILTDGHSFTAGYGKRESLGSVIFVLCKTQFSLYKGNRMGPDFSLFWAMCNHVSPKCSLDVLVQEEPKVTVRVKRCIGNGLSSFVYEAHLVSIPVAKGNDNSLYTELDTNGPFVIKIPKKGQDLAWFNETSALRTLKEEQVQDCCIFPIHIGPSKNKFIIYPLGTPAVSTVNTRPTTASLLKTEHFNGLLRDLCAIHKAGLVHRDIRLANILMVGNAAKLIDFGFAKAPGTSESIEGTVATASQAVLAAAIQDEDVVYNPKDDLESLLKVFLLHQYGFEIHRIQKKSFKKTVYAAWKQKMRTCNIEKLTYDEMIEYLERAFDASKEPWEEHTETSSSSDE